MDDLATPQVAQNPKKLDKDRSERLIAALKEIEKLGVFKIEKFHPEKTEAGEFIDPLIVIGQNHSEPDGSISEKSTEHQFEVCKAVKILHDFRSDTKKGFDSYTQDKAKKTIAAFSTLANEIVDKEGQEKLISIQIYREIKAAIEGK